ncbi:MAG TPA: hypothetical protein VLE97_09010 [Gaiellaceae bacterium]|nr:hypothetical protein [Gaiellaceae bacterium]
MSDGPAAPRYRVWCLSWEEDEEHGADVVPYDILKHDYQAQDRGVVYVPSTLFGGASDAAEAYADEVHDNRDGYECTWPLVFRVRSPDGSTADFEVDRDYVTQFTARRLPPVADEPVDEPADEPGPAEEDDGADEADTTTATSQGASDEEAASEEV